VRCLWLALALVACSGKTDDTGGAGDGGAGSGSDGGGSDGGAGDEGGSGEVIYPSGTKVLLYQGHGGHEGETTGEGIFEGASDRWSALGYSTQVRSYLPTEVADYRVIALMAPGSDGDESFSDKDVAVLQAALDQGSRVVLFGALEMCDADPAADLLASLGVSVGFTGAGSDENKVYYPDWASTEHQITDGVSDIKLKEPCWVDTGSGQLFLKDATWGHMGVAERPGSGGEVVVMGTFQWLDDGGYLDHGDNGLMADNLVIIEP
jgi:hypothetical protein